LPSIILNGFEVGDYLPMQKVIIIDNKTFICLRYIWDTNIKFVEA